MRIILLKLAKLSMMIIINQIIKIILSLLKK